MLVPFISASFFSISNTVSTEHWPMSIALHVGAAEHWPSGTSKWTVRHIIAHKYPKPLPTNFVFADCDPKVVAAVRGTVLSCFFSQLFSICLQTMLDWFTQLNRNDLQIECWTHVWVIFLCRTRIRKKVQLIRNTMVVVAAFPAIVDFNSQGITCFESYKPHYVGRHDTNYFICILSK